MRLSGAVEQAALHYGGPWQIRNTGNYDALAEKDAGFADVLEEN